MASSTHSLHDVLEMEKKTHGKCQDEHNAVVWPKFSSSQNLQVLSAIALRQQIQIGTIVLTWIIHGAFGKNLVHFKILMYMSIY